MDEMTPERRAELWAAFRASYLASDTRPAIRMFLGLGDDQITLSRNNLMRALDELTTQVLPSSCSPE